MARHSNELREAETTIRKLSMAMEHSLSLVVITDTSGAIEYVNPKFSQVTGYSSSEVLGKNPRLLKAGDLPQEVYARLWATISSGDVWRGMFHNRKKNGELYWEDASISPIHGSDGVITGYLAAKEDITEHLHAEAIMKALADRLSLAVRAGGVGIWEYDPICDRLDWDDQMFRLYGLSKEPGCLAFETWRSCLLSPDTQSDSGLDTFAGFKVIRTGG